MKIHQYKNRILHEGLYIGSTIDVDAGDIENHDFFYVEFSTDAKKYTYNISYKHKQRNRTLKMVKK